MYLARSIDMQIIHFFRRISVPVARIGLFAVFFWFGTLKLVGLSPASPLIEALFSRIVTFMDFNTFMFIFGIFECIIGMLFLVKGLERVVIPLLFIHMVTTFMPLFILPQVTWSGFFVPTLEGQYIIKNVFIIAAAMGIAAHLHPFPPKSEFS